MTSFDRPADGVFACSAETAIGQPVARFLARAYEGAGRSRPLARNLIQMQGGRLTLESALGQGTRVTVTFPSERLVEAPAPPWSELLAASWMMRSSCWEIDIDHRSLIYSRTNMASRHVMITEERPVPAAYLVRPLTYEQILQSFPLVSVSEPNLTQDQWVAYASALVGTPDLTDDPNIMALQNERGHIYGLSAYRVRPDLHRGQILEVESFAVADLVGVKRIASRLLETLETLAVRRSCSCLSIRLLSPAMRRWFRDRYNPADDVFKASGYGFEPLRLRKCFAHESRPN